MSAIQLREGIWSVGVLNPSLRVFDIVMEAKYGTSYNAYLLTGEKNVLIETVHADYFEEYEQNIRQVLPLEQVDYLIMNHNEPDHSGSVARLLDQCPGLEIFCTAAGEKAPGGYYQPHPALPGGQGGGQAGPGRQGAGVYPGPAAPLGGLHVHLGPGGQDPVYL